MINIENKQARDAYKNQLRVSKYEILERMIKDTGG